MNWKNTNLKNRFYLIAAVVLLIGMGSAILIYLTAKDSPDDIMIYEFEHSKSYRHDLELYGGKINVLASEFMHWFEGLWHGKSLALTIACITAIISSCFFFIAYYLPYDADSDDHEEQGQGRDRP